MDAGIPVSIKIRTGWDAQTINYRETAEAALSAGADMITMHARTRNMGYAGTADWEALSDLKRFVVSKTTAIGGPPVPVFGSGDLFSAEDARRMIEETGVDGVMFARGAIGNPFIFRDTQILLTTGMTPAPPTIEERVTAMRSQLILSSKDIGEKTACREMRKHASAYLKGLPFAAKAKQEMVKAERIPDYEVILSTLLESTGNHCS